MTQPMVSKHWRKNTPVDFMQMGRWWWWWWWLVGWLVAW